MSSAEARRNLISDAYLAAQQQMHREMPHYGVSGQKYTAQVAELAEILGVSEILDYGAGKETLREGLPQYTVRGYDPALDWLSQPPDPAPIVVCTDVMEHIEEERVDTVLAHIADLAQQAAYFQIATVPASKTLPDGRNAHICLQDAQWWLNRLWQYFDIDRALIESAGVQVWCSRKVAQ